MKVRNGILKMNKMNTREGRFLKQLQILAKKIDPGNEHPIKRKEEKLPFKPEYIAPRGHTYLCNFIFHKGFV